MNGGIGVELNWLQSLVLGLFSGLTDILPVSSQAHQTLLLKLFGADGGWPLLRLVIHLATFLTLLAGCWGQVHRIRRQLRILRLPKRRRTRMPDMTAVMDAKILKTALWPIALGILCYVPVSRLGGNLLWLVAASLLNGALLYLPGMFPSANKDSRLVTPGESLLMGLGAGAAVLPGLSSVGVSYSVGVLHGVDRGYMIHLTLLMHMMYTVGMIVCDVVALITQGIVALNGGVFVCCLLAAGSAAVGTGFGIRILRAVAKKSGLTGFSCYSFGVALFTFILYLMV